MKQTNLSYTDIPLFSGIAEENLRAMLRCLHAHEKAFKKGEILIMDRDHVQQVGVVLSDPGQLMGEMFAVQHEPSAYVSFVAAEDTRVLFLRVDNIIHDCPNRCAFHGRLVTNFFDLLGRKGVSLMEKIEVSSRPSLREKILAYLSMQAQKQESRYITLPLNRTEMASYLHANRSAMTRELSEMQAEGLIEFDGNTFVIK